MAPRSAGGGIPDPGRRLPALLGAIGAAVLVGGALGLAFLPPPWRQPGVLGDLQVPVDPGPASAYLRLASDLGLDLENGLLLVSVRVADPQQAVAGYRAGRFAAAPLTTVEAVELCGSPLRRCPRLVLILAESRGGHRVLMRPEVVDLEGFRGRPVAVGPSALGPYLLGRGLEGSGLTLPEVRLVVAPAGRIAGLLHRGEVEGAVLSSPFSDDAARLGDGRTVFDSGRLPGEILEVLAVDPALLAGRPEVVAALLRAWEGAHRWARQHPREAEVRLAASSTLSASGFTRAEAGLRYVALADQRALLVPGGAVAAQVEAVAREMEGLALLPAGSPLPEVDPAPLRLALEPLRGARP